jgi:hypothetical protein
MTTKVLDRLESEAGRAVRQQASRSIASLSRVPIRNKSGTVRLSKTSEPKPDESPISEKSRPQR